MATEAKLVGLQWGWKQMLRKGNGKILRDSVGIEKSRGIPTEIKTHYIAMLILLHCQLQKGFRQQLLRTAILTTTKSQAPALAFSNCQ